MRKSARRSIACLAAMFSSLAWCNANASLIVSTAAGSGADTFVQAGTSAGSNFGSSVFVNVKNPSTPNQFTRKPYLRFDLAGLTQAVSTASLDLVVASNDSGGSNPAPNSFTVNVYGLNDLDPGENWGEGTITWNNAPGNNTSSGTGFLGAQTVSLGSFNVTTADTAGSTVSFSSTALVNFLNSDTNGIVTIMLARTEGGSKNLTFHSKENILGANAPQLNIVPVPEPSTALISVLLMGVFSVCRRARRRVS